MLTVKSKVARFGLAMKSVLEFIDKHPRIILLMAWPVFTAIIIGLILIFWLGGWPVVMAAKQLDILGGIAFFICSTLLLNQLAQSSSFFGKLGLKIGTVFDLNADMDEKQSRASAKAEPDAEA